MSYHYWNRRDERDGWRLPTLWVEEFTGDEAAEFIEERDRPETTDDIAGFYWCNCIPGCMPDSDWSGPFATEEQAVEAARDLYDCGGDDDLDDDDEAQAVEAERVEADRNTAAIALDPHRLNATTEQVDAHLDAARRTREEADRGA